MIGDGGLVLLWWEFGQDCRFCGAWLWRWGWVMGDGWVWEFEVLA